MLAKEKVAFVFIALTLLLSIPVLTVLVPAVSASSNDNESRGAIHLVKTCPTFPSPAVCTVLTSTSGPIPAGTVAVYFGSFSPSLKAIVVLVTPDGSTAKGHVTLDYTSGLGTVTFGRDSSGTGNLEGFRASIAVNCQPGCPGPTTWDGTYRISS